MSAKGPWWERHLLWVDTGLALLVYGGVIAVAHWLGWLKFEWRDDEWRTFLATLASVSGSLFAFTITGVTVVSGLMSVERLEIIAKSPQLAMIFEVFFSASRWLAAALLFSVVGMVAPVDKHAWAFGLVVGFVAFLCMARVARIVWVLNALARLLVPPPRVMPKAPSFKKRGAASEELRRAERTSGGAEDSTQ